MGAAADNFAPDLAIALIDRYGISAQIPSASQTNSYDPDSGKVTQSVVQNVTVTASPPVRPRAELAGTDVTLLNSSITYLKGSDGGHLTLGDTVILSGITYRIVRIDPLISGARVAAYRLWLQV